MSVIRNELLLATDEATGYNLTKSLRFRSSASAYLSRTPASASNQKTWTWSAWLKRGKLTGYQMLFEAGASGSVNSGIQLHTSSDSYSLELYVYNSGYTARLLSSQLMRDPAAWYHIVAVYDSTQATSSDRMALYVNGVKVTGLAVATYPSQNTNSDINGTTQHNIGQFVGESYFDGYLTEVNFIDGQALTPSSFGETDSITGVWKPKAYTGTYGTNGFYLPFTDVATTSGSNAGLGKDFSGNGNYWTTNNISVTSGSTYDSMTDVPTLTSATAANYAVINPLLGVGTISNGNLSITGLTGDNLRHSTIGISSGKWYSEFYVDNMGAGSMGVALYSASATGTVNGSQSRGYYYNGQKYSNGSLASYGNSYTTGDVIGIAVDLDNSKIWFSKNGTWQASGDPVAGTNAAYTDITANTWFITIQGGNVFTASANFGQRPFAYTPPSGFKALNTYNLPDSTIVAGNTVMDVVTRSGFGASGGSITSLAFRPDFIWEKSRNNAYNHQLVDSVRGLTKYLNSNLTDAENTQSNYFTSLNSNGYTLGSNDYGTSVTLVDWVWQAGQGTTSSNTAGSITSTVSVNASAGFSIVTYTGTGANATVGHGLGVAPKMVIVKCRNTAGESWQVYHSNLTSAAYRIRLNSADGQDSQPTMWNSTAPTSSVFSVGTASGVNANTQTYVAYCWADVNGFAKFGSYVGNASADGSFAYTGFRPRYLMIKASSSTSDWTIFDTARETFNDDTRAALFANLSDAETGGSFPVDILSNGFKVRNSGTGTNSSGVTYIYTAFAENPFKNSLAR